MSSKSVKLVYPGSHMHNIGRGAGLDARTKGGTQGQSSELVDNDSQIVGAVHEFAEFLKEFQDVPKSLDTSNYVLVSDGSWSAVPGYTSSANPTGS